MRNYRLSELIDSLASIVGKKNCLTDEKKMNSYSKGIRVGSGSACAVVLPKNLLQLWEVLKICVAFDKIIILQAANTGLTGGSTPDGNNYDRDIVIINTLNIDKLIILRSGLEIISFPGTTLFQLEEALKPSGRGPHSVIGSSCIGASVIGGVCNNSGGNLVNRGPAYTELSLFAKINKSGELELVNHLDIDLGNTPEEIIRNLESSNLSNITISPSNRNGSDNDYKERVRDIRSKTPARFNSDSRRLFESSGCAGKIAVFAVRLDTFPLPKKEQVYFLGSNDSSILTSLRETILTDFKVLPDMGEYMHTSYFEASAKYSKDSFLFLKFFGTKFLPILIRAKILIDMICQKISFLPKHISDIIIQFFVLLFPDHVPRRIRKITEKYKYFMIFLTSDNVILPMKNLLEDFEHSSSDCTYLECTEKEGKDVLLLRYVAGSAPVRYKIINNKDSGEFLPLDIALPRNFKDWEDIFPKDILNDIKLSFSMAHFLCMVFHCDLVLKKGVDAIDIKKRILIHLDKIGAKYPAEHNVGHLYKAEQNLKNFYQNLDPTNSFNSGIGQTSKQKNYD
tara:strand:- start:2952 stop:4652 length:1701 start_codon:yes stop_codon:yes gene_type:complete